MAATPDTSQRILDIAEAMEVTKASLHYHFRSKAELGARLIERYEKNFLAALAAIDEEADGAADKLRRYVAIYTSVVRANRMCLCGMLAAEYGTLPEAMRDDMRHFFDENERWLVGVLKEGKRSKQLAFKGTPADVAQALVGSLEGAMMMARSYGDPARFEAVCERLLAELGA